MILPVFIGHDSREHAAYMVCRDTLKRHGGVEVHSLRHRELRRQGIFTRPWRIDEKGQYWDDRDGRPFSTEFSHTRFLTPQIARGMGYRGWVMFVDCDFMFLSPVSQLLPLLDPSKALMVVQHALPTEGTKMDGMIQQNYQRKLWSSLMLFNLDHEANDALGAEEANAAAGGSLHRFGWLDDNDIGALPESWNWIPGHSSDSIAPDAVHFSFGGPWMPGYHDVAYAELWRRAHLDMVRRSADDPELYRT